MALDWHILKQGDSMRLTSNRSRKKFFRLCCQVPLQTMTSLEMSHFAWMNMFRVKTVEFPAYQDFMCKRLGSTKLTTT